jgi:hypothetical protein
VSLKWIKSIYVVAVVANSAEKHDVEQQFKNNKLSLWNNNYYVGMLAKRKSTKLLNRKMIIGTRSEK